MSNKKEYNDQTMAFWRGGGNGGNGSRLFFHFSLFLEKPEKNLGLVKGIRTKGINIIHVCIHPLKTTELPPGSTFNHSM